MLVLSCVTSLILILCCSSDLNWALGIKHEKPVLIDMRQITLASTSDGWGGASGAAARAGGHPLFSQKVRNHDAIDGTLVGTPGRRGRQLSDGTPGTDAKCR